jgi:hypothetical protein
MCSKDDKYGSHIKKLHVDWLHVDDDTILENVINVLK